MAPMDEPRHKTVKVWFGTYRELRKLAAEKPESMAALLDRLTKAERERRDRETRNVAPNVAGARNL